MLELDTLKATFPSYAKDIKINLSRVLTEENSKGLSLKQIAGVALASAYACNNKALITELTDIVKDSLDENDIEGIKSAVSIMAMNNVYYRSIGMISDESYAQLQVGLRMQVIAKPAIDKLDFELYCLAVSAINACGHCIDSHEKVLRQSGLPQHAIQASLRIAAIIQASTQVFQLEN